MTGNASDADKPSVLWVDDNASQLNLAMRRVRERVSMRVERTYENARNLIEWPFPFDAVLLDAILPRADRRGAVEEHLGVKLAERIVEVVAQHQGKVRIAFLTVVVPDQIMDSLKHLKAMPALTGLRAFDKTSLGDPYTSDQICRFLTGGIDE